jgi:hypothetical protein
MAITKWSIPVEVISASLGMSQASRLRRRHCAAEATDMGEHVLLFCLLGLVLTATIILVTAPGAVTWALALIE